MKKTIILTLALILIVPVVIALENCKGTMFQQDVPCLLILPVNTSFKACNTINVSVFVNGSNFLYSQTMHEYNSFKCNATFNQTNFGTYTFLYNGTDDTGTLVVEEDRIQLFFLYIAAIFIFISLLGLGWWKEEGIFVMIAGMLAVIIGITIFVNGFPNSTNTFLRNGVTTIIWGIGAYLILLPGMEFFENWRDRE